MKWKVFSILFALLLVLSLGIVTATPAPSVTPSHDRTTAITAAVDRLVAEQNPNGGFRMWISETPPGYLRTHNIGVTATGILKAYELQDKTEYETALAMAYKFVLDHEPGWIQDPGDTTKWKESPGGVNSWPDIHFLIGLSEAAESDSSLLAAINALIEPDITANDIAALAKYRWDDRLNHAGAVWPSDVGTATGMAKWLVDLRVGQGYGTLIPWDLEAAVKSAIALDEKYPEGGYLGQADAITEEIYDCIYGDPSYLDIHDPTERCYTLGLAGAIEAFSETGLYPGEADEIKDQLIAYQNEAGFWDANDRTDEDAGTQCVQETAYSVMALVEHGDADARTAAMKGCNWLVNTQDTLGGWNPSSFESGDENLEVDGEATWALATAEAPVTNGDKGYYSIQSAIDAASPGDTINVATGTYNENVIVNKELNIIAASSPVVDGGGSGACFGIYESVGLSNVTIEGFEIRNATYGIWIYGAGASSTTYNNITLTNNNIHNHAQNGILVTDCTVNGLTVSGNSVDNSGMAISFANNSTVDGLTVAGNTITNNNAGLSLIWGKFSNVTVTDCDFTSNAWEHIDLGCWGNNPTITNVNISGCTFSTGPWAAIYLQSNNLNIVINYNYFCVGAWGICDVSPSGTIDALNNFWGAADGPGGAGSGSGDLITSNVDYEPWATIDFTGGPQPYDNVILEAAVSNWNEEIEVDFYFDGFYEGTATTAGGLASLNIGPQLVGVHDAYAKVSCVQSDTALVAAYDATAGFVTGGGWIDSPPGAYMPSDTTVVTEANVGVDWLINDTRYDGYVAIVEGPQTPPLGTGSLEMGSTATQDKAQLFNYDHIGTLLADIDSIIYATYRDGSSTNPTAQYPAINIEVDFVGDGSSYTTLVWEPIYAYGQSNLAVDTWQTWDTMAPSQTGFGGGWWSTKNIPGVCEFNCFVDWDTIIQNNPNAKIKYGLGVNIGSGWNGIFIGAVDALAITVNGETTTYDFESVPPVTGKATFGFVSKYKKGATIPEGQTEFQFKAADLNFHSSSYDWLVVTGSDFARFKGTGTINGEGEYKFMLWAGDGDPDTFRIKIWYEVDDTQIVVYDNGMDQPIGGGSIVVHAKDK